MCGNGSKWIGPTLTPSSMGTDSDCALGDLDSIVDLLPNSWGTSSSSNSCQQQQQFTSSNNGGSPFEFGDVSMGDLFSLDEHESIDNDLARYIQ